MGTPLCGHTSWRLHRAVRSGRLVYIDRRFVGWLSDELPVPVAAQDELAVLYEFDLGGVFVYDRSGLARVARASRSGCLFED